MGLANIGGLQLDFLPRDTDKTQGFEASEDKTQAVVRAVVRMVTMGWPNAEAALRYSLIGRLYVMRFKRFLLSEIVL